MINTDIETLKALDLFDGFAAEELDEIAPSTYSMRVIEGERLIRAGDVAHNLYIILSGSFMLHAADGKSVTIHERGDIMGVSSVLGAATHSLNVTALTDGAVIVISGVDLQQAIAYYVESGEAFISKIYTIVEERQAVFGMAL
jgi:CRP-like cAMP-binding protein